MHYQVEEKKEHLKMWRGQRRFVMMGLVPILVFYVVFLLFPIFFAGYLSFHKWSLLGSSKSFVGIEQYTTVLKDRVFQVAFWNALYYTGSSVLIRTLLALGLALLVTSLPRKFGLSTVVRSIIFIPVVATFSAITLMFKFFLDPVMGVGNYYLGFVGLGPFSFIYSPTQVIPTIVLLTTWKTVGYFMIMFIAGLTTIPNQLYEAGKIDGTSSWQAFWHITLPLLRPTLAFVLIISCIWELQAFDQFYVFSGGGPGIASLTMVLHIFNTGFKFFRMGEAAAISFLLFAVIIFFSIVQLKGLREKFEY